MTRAMQSAQIDYTLATMRLDGIKGRIEREGMSRGTTLAFAETINQLAHALIAIDTARLGSLLDEGYRELAPEVTS